jgi:hypothetical protein
VDETGKNMTELTSKRSESNRAKTLIVALVLFAAAAIGIFIFARYQKHSQPAGPSGPVVVPGMLHAGDPNFEYYKNRIRLEDVKAGLGITFNKNRVAIISGIIYNDGDRKLEALELRVTLYDLYGKFSKSRIATPLRPGTGMYRPMEPLEKRTFSVSLEGVEQLWNPRKVEIEITGLKYQ